VQVEITRSGISALSLLKAIIIMHTSDLESASLRDFHVLKDALHKAACIAITRKRVLHTKRYFRSWLISLYVNETTIRTY
jgi:uncharacterized membrane protein